MQRHAVKSFIFSALVIVIAIVLIPGSLVHAGERPYIGMQPQELPKEALAALGLDVTGNIIMIRDVGRNTPAAKAGVMPGDFLLAVGDDKVTSLVQLIALIENISPGDSIRLSVARDGNELELELVVDVWPAAQAISKSKAGSLPSLGLTMVGLTKEVRQQFGLRWDSQGLLVSLVDPSKGISEIIRRGDIIVQVNGRDVWLPQQVIDIYRAAKDADQRQVVMLLERINGNALILLPVK